MSKITKVISGILGLVALFMMFLPQVSIHWNSDPIETIGLAALVGGNYQNGVPFTGAGAGLAGYILAGVGALLIILCALLPFFKEHDVLNYIVLAAGLICLIIAIILIFLIRRNFADTNGFNSKEIYVGAGAMVGGSLAALATFFGGLGFIVDIAK